MTPYVLHPAVRNFLKPLSQEVKHKVSKQLFLLQTLGRALPPPDSKKISRELFELRVQSKIQVRLLYGFSEGTALVVHAFVKKTQKIPPREIELAHKRFMELAR